MVTGWGRRSHQDGVADGHEPPVHCERRRMEGRRGGSREGEWKEGGWEGKEGGRREGKEGGGEGGGKRNIKYTSSATQLPVFYQVATPTQCFVVP